MQQPGDPLWWDCDLCELWLDWLGPLLVGEEEWIRRRAHPQERRALRGLSAIGMALLLGLMLALLPSVLGALASFLWRLLWSILWLFFAVWIPLSMLCIAVGAVIQ